MNNLVFLDTETTGISPFEDWLFQVCYSHNSNIVCEYFKPPTPISIKAQSITHITNKVVENKSMFKDSTVKNELQELLKTNILVAHNATFDICMVSKEGIDVPQYICTLKVARFLDEECIIPEYNLQYLRYYYELDVEVDAHDAKGDVIVLEALFKILYEKMLQKLGDPELVIAKMIEVSSQPFLLKLFNFGKYKGRRVEEVFQLDRGYLEWMLRAKMESGKDEEDWIFTLKYHLGNS